MGRMTEMPTERGLQQSSLKTVCNTRITNSLTESSHQAEPVTPFLIELKVIVVRDLRDK
ncbi:hypothetical protein Lepto7375DRAFT_2754 [Leptolyngbya sp. PCC 7375]|nr:hypothetical protein Lepto7375DRAFT_2754 [Leptolyngbya sp. PCC 7375]